MWMLLLFEFCSKSLLVFSRKSQWWRKCIITVSQSPIEYNHSSPACCSCCSMLSEVFVFLNISNFHRVFVVFVCFAVFFIGRESSIEYLGQDLKSLFLFVRKCRVNFEECTRVDVFNMEFPWTISSWKVTVGSKEPSHIGFTKCACVFKVFFTFRGSTAFLVQFGRPWSWFLYVNKISFLIMYIYLIPCLYSAQ